ncbi:MAG: methyl-accepting chemotaxis protein, partial [Halomonadaceae bacterium]
MPQPDTSRRVSHGASRFSGLQTKILALVLIPLFLVAAVLVTVASLEQRAATEQALAEQQRQLTQARKDKVQSIVESAHSTITPLLNDPTLSNQAIRQRVYELLQNVRFDGSNYIWAYDYDGISTVLGDNPQLVGTDNYNMQGSDGTYIVQGMIKTGRNGGGFYGYDWEHPETGQLEPKQSYVLDMPELGWVMGAGVYMNDITRTMAAVRAEAEDALQESIITAVLIGLGVFIIVALVAIWLVRRLVRPINQTASAMRDIAQGRGDLTQRLDVTTDDEIGALAEQFNAFVERMQTTLVNVRRSVYEVHHAANEMAQGSEELASRTEQAAANLQETSSSMEEITSTVNHSSESAQQANQLATSTVTVARQGGEAMTEVEQTMGNLNDSAARIGEIITMIDGIAFQTNILALNASVEAARAGEHGRGFAVVAQEVRDLASRSANASSEIRGLIDTATTYTRQGSETVQRAGATMREIVDSVIRVTDVIAEISAGAREQNAGISQVNTAVTEMDTMTQQNSSMVQQTSSTAEAMRDQAARLSELVDTFVLGDDDIQPTARRTPAPLPATHKATARPPTPASITDNDWEEF